ncbi:hypothetical protein HOA92_04745 [archaeon]|jgi:hypothetical protein|nr:hypothetical protein [archaeon]MBT6762325.1 hypothetical protein [archaeon]
MAYIVGIGTNQDFASEDMYDEAKKVGATGSPEEFLYRCVFDLPSGEIEGEESSDYNVALQSALDDAKLGKDYDVDLLSVIVRADFNVPELPAKPVAAGSIRSGKGNRTLTSLF